MVLSTLEWCSPVLPIRQHKSMSREQRMCLKTNEKERGRKEGRKERRKERRKEGAKERKKERKKKEREGEQ